MEAYEAQLQASITWTDVTAYTRRVSIRRGRSSELDDFQAGTCTLVLDNSAVAATEGHTMSRVAFGALIDALHFELDTPKREPHRQVMRALGDEHNWPRWTFRQRAFDANHAFADDREVTG